MCRLKIFLRLGVSSNNENDFKAAVAFYDPAIATNPDCYQAWSNRGNALQDLGHHQEALTSYDRAIAINPDFYAAWINRATTICNLSIEQLSSIDSTFSNSAGLDWFFINDVIPAADWVATAKHVLPKQQSKSREDELWDKIGRIVVMTIGGASRGAAIAQLPGAIIVGLLAAGYGWYISFSKQASAKNF